MFSGINLREIVNAGMLPQFIGRKVSVTGFVQNVNPNGLTFELRTTDDAVVKVNFKKPYKNILQGHVQVHGTAQANSIICDDIVQFSADSAENFDAPSYNMLCNLLQTVPNLWDTSN